MTGHRKEKTEQKTAPCYAHIYGQSLATAGRHTCAASRGQRRLWNDTQPPDVFFFFCQIPDYNANGAARVRVLEMFQGLLQGYFL